MSIKVANGSLVQHKGTIPARLGSARLGSGRLTCDYNAISVQLQLQLPTGTELGNNLIDIWRELHPDAGMNKLGLS